jgi:DNA-binding PadR family transcriptional regulator
MSERKFKLPSPSEMAILELLADNEMYGLELVGNSGRLNLSRGSVYTMLARMQHKGLLSSRYAEEGELASGRRFYKLTEYGHRALSAWQVLTGGI